MIGMGWPDQQPGGLNTYVSSMAEQLALEHQLDVFVSCKEQVTSPATFQLHNIVAPDKGLKTKTKAFQLAAAKWMDEGTVDVVYAHFAPYSLGVAQEAKKRNIPVVVGFHGPWSQEMEVEGSGFLHALKCRAAKSIEMQMYRLADRFIVLSDRFRAILQDDYRVDDHHIVKIVGAADEKQFFPTKDKEKIRELLQLPKQKKVVLSIRRLVHRMGLLELVDAWKQVVEQEDDVLLVIGGKGALQDQLQQKIQTLGLAHHVLLTGYIPQDKLPLYYQAADLFVVPSQALEGFGLITVEALASGTPVVATPIGGNSEILTPFSPHMVLKGTSALHMEEGLKHVIKNREQWPTSAECRAYVEKHFTWEVVSRQVEEVLKSSLVKEGSEPCA